MDKELFKKMLEEAVKERETGSVEKSLEIFGKVDESTLEPDQFHLFVGQRGLTYWHAKNYEKAKEDFIKLKQQAEDLKNDSYMAVALRQLSRPEFNEDNLGLALKYAKDARELAFKVKREDLVWFDHGVVLALTINNGSPEDIKEWFEIEAKDLYEISQNTKDEIAKWVWYSGLLIDRSKVYNSKEDLYLALMVANQFNLERRKEQIRKLIEEFEKK